MGISDWIGVLLEDNARDNIDGVIALQAVETHNFGEGITTGTKSTPKALPESQIRAIWAPTNDVDLHIHRHRCLGIVCVTFESTLPVVHGNIIFYLHPRL